MKLSTNIVKLTVLIVPAITLNLGAASADSVFDFAGNQNKNGYVERNISSLSVAREGTQRVCCTNYTHDGGYSGCATFDAKHCPNYARFTPAPE